MMADVGRILSAATNAFLRDKLRIVRRSGLDMISGSQMALFQNLDIAGTRLTTIATRARMSKPGMLELVNQAEALDLVVRQPDGADGRAKIVRFTPFGLRLLDRLRDGVIAAELKATGLMGEAFTATMKARLAAYAATTDGTADGAVPVIGGSGAPWRTDNLGRVLAMAAARFDRELLSIVRAGSDRNVGGAMLALFRDLDPDHSTLTRLAADARVTKQSMRALLVRAEAAGLVVRLADATDRRTKSIVLTDAGRGWLVGVRQAARMAEARFDALVGGEIATTLKATLADYSRLAETANSSTRRPPNRRMHRNASAAHDSAPTPSTTAGA